METSVSVIRFPGCVFTDLPQIDNFLCFQKLFLTSVLLLGKKQKTKKQLLAFRKFKLFTCRATYELNENVKLQNMTLND